MLPLPLNQFVSKTIYSVATPTTHRLLQTLLLQDATPRYQETWTKKQDAFHLEYLDRVKTTLAPLVDIQQHELHVGYPTNGSSEAIREQIVFLASQHKRLVVFEGEYEGYEAIANAIAMPVLKCPRPTTLDELQIAADQLHETDVMFMSIPASCDGNYWPYTNQWMRLLSQKERELYIDFASSNALDPSIHAVPKDVRLDGVFWSLSKWYGVYYHRIGGVFLRKPNPLLHGNIWFKNILSIEYGNTLLREYPLTQATQVLRTYQEKAIALFNLHGLSLKPSHIPLIATCNTDALPKELAALLYRYPTDQTRVCISPLLETLMYRDAA